MAKDTLDLTPTDERLCGQCNGRRMAEVIGKTFYSFQITDPDQVLHWDVTKARQLVKERDGEPFSAREALEWVQKYGNIEQGHLLHLPESVLDEPILVDVLYVREKPGAPEQVLPIIIDGSHRIVRCILARKPIRAIILTPDESKAVLEVRKGERYAELVRDA